MIIRTELRKATRRIGTRVVAESNEGHRWVELYDWNQSEAVNHYNAASQIASVMDVGIRRVSENRTDVEWHVDGSN